jgi:hypothetical protein
VTEFKFEAPAYLLTPGEEFISAEEATLADWLSAAEIEPDIERKNRTSSVRKRYSASSS